MSPVIEGVDSDKAVYPILIDSSGRPYVLLTDGTTTAGIDSVLTAICTIDGAHHLVHEGRFFIVSHFFSQIADTVDAMLRITVGANKELHASGAVTSEAKGELAVYEGTTYTDEGTAVVIYDKNRTTGNTSDAAAKHTPTVNAAGTKILNTWLPGGTKSRAVGASRSDAEEWVLKKSTDYLVSWTNRGGAAKDATMVVVFYEV